MVAMNRVETSHSFGFCVTDTAVQAFRERSDFEWRSKHDYLLAVEIDRRIVAATSTKSMQAITDSSSTLRTYIIEIPIRFDRHQSSGSGSTSPELAYAVIRPTHDRRGYVSSHSPHTYGHGEHCVVTLLDHEVGSMNFANGRWKPVMNSIGDKMRDALGKPVAAAKSQASVVDTDKAPAVEGKSTGSPQEGRQLSTGTVIPFPTAAEPTPETDMDMSASKSTSEGAQDALTKHARFAKGSAAARDFMARVREAKKAKPGLENAGVSVRVMELLSDGQPRSTVMIAKALKINIRVVADACKGLLYRGALKRPSRAVYVSAKKSSDSTKIAAPGKKTGLAAALREAMSDGVERDIAEMCTLVNEPDRDRVAKSAALLTERGEFARGTPGRYRMVTKAPKTVKPHASRVADRPVGWRTTGERAKRTAFAAELLGQGPFVTIGEINDKITERFGVGLQNEVLHKLQKAAIKATGIKGYLLPAGQRKVDAKTGQPITGASTAAPTPRIEGRLKTDLASLANAFAEAVQNEGLAKERLEIATAELKKATVDFTQCQERTSLILKKMQAARG